MGVASCGEVRCERLSNSFVTVEGVARADASIEWGLRH